MPVETLAPARARAAARQLDQYLIRCPGCEQAAAVHVDAGVGAVPLVVRVVCPDGCAVAAEEVLARLPFGSREALTA